jgi:hypothetical protein
MRVGRSTLKTRVQPDGLGISTNGMAHGVRAQGQISVQRGIGGRGKCLNRAKGRLGGRQEAYQKL